MKKNLFLVVALVLVSCTDQLLVGEVAGDSVEQAPASEISSLMERARWGDGQACLKLADCYRDGIGVKADFVSMMSMLSMAEDFGAINRIEDYFGEMPFNNELEFLAKWTKDEADRDAVLGALAVERGDTLRGIQMIQAAAEQESSLAILLRCSTNLNTIAKPGVTKLIEAAEKVPYAYKILGNIYSGNDYPGLKDDKLAAYYYMKADEKACLGRDGARWLLAYHRNGGNLTLSERDIERLEMLAGVRIAESEVIQHADLKLEAAITELLHENVEEYEMWSKAMVYVVETKTGKIKANVSYERKGEEFIPYIDTYNQEQSVMECGSTYLALMSSGKVTPEHVFDTGCGIYGDVRDHNWRRGGYGNISLDRALEVRSQVAFTMAKEYVYGGNSSEFDDLIFSYHAGRPNSALGILTFYNAVANGGKMVELVSKGEDGIVIQEQIAEPKHIEVLKTGLEHCVSQGLMRKAGRAYVNVSACGRTFIVKGNYRRMELCGYFPSDNPLYTIMVILEKEGIPASAGGLCGPIFAQTVDLLVDTYQLQPMLTRQYEDVDEVIEVVDTVAMAN